MASIVEALRHALARLNAGDLDAAERISREVLGHEPDNVDAWHLAGLVCRKTQRPAESVAAFRRAIELQPERAIYWFELGIVLKQQGDIEGALAANRQAVTLNPSMQEAYVNGGAALDDLGRHVEALQWYEQSLALAPGCPSTLMNIGNALQSLGRLSESITSYRRALEISPQNAHAHWNLAMALLRTGDFSQGWQEYEWRAAAGETKLDEYPQPLWDGSPLAGKTLLVHAEQGVGDEILFASCYPELVAQARHCTFICEPRLAPLFARSFPQATVHGYRRKHERTPCEVQRHIDFQIPAGSLPRYLRTSAESFPQRSHYLVCDPMRKQLWQKRLAELGPGLKIGISWRAGGKPSEHVRRTTGLALWRRLLSLPGVQYVNLQYGEAADEIAKARSRFGVTIHDWPDADALTDLDGLAAQMSALDLVIAVGNTTVHLAGSLGVPAWCILPAYPSWRWMSEGDCVPWYSSVRLFRQRRGESWQRVFDELYAELCRLPGLDGHSCQETAAQENIPICEEPPVDEAAGTIPAQVSGLKFVAKLTENLETAVKLHQTGDLAAAEAIYREVLKSTPQHVDALHLLGVVCQQTGRTAQGIRYLRQAIALCDSVANFHFHLGVALRQSGDIVQAQNCYRRTIELNPDFAEAHLNLGSCLQELGRLDEAIACFQQALRGRPDTAGIHFNLGVALAVKGALADAQRHLQQALALQPVYPEADAQLGQVLEQTGRLDEAIEHYRRAIEARPAYAAAHRCLAKAYHSQKRLDEAILCYQRALELKPEAFEVLADLGLAFAQQQQFTLAVEHLRRALRSKPRHAPTLLHLATALRHLGRLDEALECCDQVLAGDPGQADAAGQHAEILLQLGKFAEGFDERHVLARRTQRRRFDVPEWDGSPLEGRSILVRGGGVLEDEVQYASCLNEVIARSQRCLIQCDPRLERLWRRSFPAAAVQADRAYGDEHLPPYDVQVALDDLPRLLRRCESDFPSQPRYLTADPVRLHAERERLQRQGDALNVGLLWQSVRKSTSGTAFAPDWQHWRPLLSTSDVQFTHLGGPSCRKDMGLAADCWGVAIHDGLGDDRSIDALAALLSALDLVISVDDFVVHLSGALGTSVWTVLPQGWGWRWGIGRTSPWYRSMRLFRAAAPNAWPALMQQIAAEVAQLARSRRLSLSVPQSSVLQSTLAAPKFLHSPRSRGVRHE